MEPFFRFCNPANFAKSLLVGDRDHLLAEARSELTKQECKVDSLNTCTRELQRQTYSQRLELEDSGYAESRREELVMRFRDTHIGSIHEMEQLKGPQELRVDEFFAQKLREPHDTIQKLISQKQELQERANCISYSG